MILMNLLIGVDSFYMVSTISFTCLIFIEFLNLFTQVLLTLSKLHHIKAIQIASIVMSLMIYFGSLFFMKK
jgi:hypothetical protein